MNISAKELRSYVNSPVGLFLKEVFEERLKSAITLYDSVKPEDLGYLQGRIEEIRQFTDLPQQLIEEMERVGVTNEEEV